MLAKCMRLEVVDNLVQFVGQNPYCSSEYLAMFLECWKHTIMRRLKVFSKKKVWSTWTHHNLSPNHDRANLKPHGSVLRPRVNKFGLIWALIFWNTSGVLHKRFLEKSLTVTKGIYYLKLTHIADQYCSHYDRTAKSCGLILLQDNAVSPRQIKRKMKS